MPSSIAIIGMGACGVAAFAEATIRLAASPLSDLTIHLVSRDQEPGPGLAFGTDQPGHLLNTESRLMGMYAHEAGHFRDWLAERRSLDPDGVEYAPRAEYGAYIRHILADAHQRADRAGVTVRVHRAEAIAIDGTRDASLFASLLGTREKEAAILVALSSVLALALVTAAVFAMSVAGLTG